MPFVSNAWEWRGMLQTVANRPSPCHAAATRLAAAPVTGMKTRGADGAEASPCASPPSLFPRDVRCEEKSCNMSWKVFRHRLKGKYL